METRWIENVLEWVNAVVSLEANLLVQSAFLAGAGLLLARLLRRHGAANRSAVLRIALALVLLCPMVTLGLSLAGIGGMAPEIPRAMVGQTATRFADDAPTGQAETSPSASGQNGPGQSHSSVARESDGGAGVAKLPRSASAASHASVRWTLQPLAWLYIALSALWPAGAAFLALRLVVAHVRMARLRRQATPAPEALLAACRTLARGMGVRAPQVLLSPRIQSPCLVGLVRPAILLPDPSEGECPGVVPEVIVHELAHRLRGDCAWNLLGHLACAAPCFQPLVWLLASRVEEASDEVADDCVLQRGLDAATFAGTLFAIAERSRPAAFEALAGQGIVAFRSALGRRVARILDPTRRLSPHANRGAVALSLAGGVALVLLAATLGLRPRPQFQAVGARPPAGTSPTSATVAVYTPLPRVELGQPSDNTELDRIRQQIYLLRLYTLTGKSDTWVGAIRELAAIGRPAVPELSAELRRGGRSTTQAAIAIALRAIGDPRATPALIYALGHSFNRSSDYGNLITEDLDLEAFMKRYDALPIYGPEGFSFGRSIREITVSLEALTGHSEGREHTIDHDWLGRPFQGSYQPTDAVQRRFVKRRDATAGKWLAWWKARQGDLLQPDEMAEVKAWEAVVPGDPVAEAGLRAFGPPIPHGSGAILGPVVEVTLSSLSLDSQRTEFLSFRTGQLTAQPKEVLRARSPHAHLLWCRRNGLDVVAQSYRDEERKEVVGSLFSDECTVWRISNDRWARLDEEIRSARPLVLGDPENAFRVSRDPEKTPPASHTFLFRTGNGDAGALQILGLNPDQTGLRIQYRMVETGSQPKAVPAAQAPQPQ